MFLVIRHHHMGATRDLQIRTDLDTSLMKAFDFLQELLGIHHDAVADDAGCSLPQNPGRDQVQDVLGLADNDRVSGVGSALGSGYDVRLFGHEIDDLALTLVAPLGAH